MSLEAQKYGEFLQKQREQWNIERELLGEGIYSLNTIGKIERGARYPDKLTRDRLLARIGESGHDYENYLTLEEYADWEERRDILDSLDDGELEKADKLIREYAEHKEMESVVTRQFWLAMRLQYLELSGATEEEKYPLIEEAVKLTVPAVDTKPVDQLALSVQELNLVLEYVTYRKPENQEETYQQLFTYIQSERFDRESRAMFGSKVALYYCRYLKDRQRMEQGLLKQLEQMEYQLKICTQGIDWLRDHSKAYFAWELLLLKEKYLNGLLNNKSLFAEKRVEQYEQELEQTKDFLQMFNCLYERYQISKETNVVTCFYREYEVYCINDVIRARRRMLGITAEELEEELICSKSTLKRLEKNERNVQIAIAQNLFRKLNLSMEMHRAQIVTDSQEALRLEEKYREALNRRDCKQAETFLQNMEQIISMDELINKQYICHGKIELRYMKEEITKEEYIKDEMEALEYTIWRSVALAKIKDATLRNGQIRKGEKYLTNTEVTILKNIADEIGTQESNEYWNSLKEYYIWLEKKCTLAPFFGMYGFVMTSVASCMGNEGFYEESNTLNKKIVMEALRLKSLSYVRRNLYGVLWNDRKQKGLPMEKEDPKWRSGLLECLSVDIYCKDEMRASIMRKRLGLEV